MKIRYPFPLTLLFPAVFVSGATALIYEIVWTRHLALLLGSTTGAAAAVLGSFMLGLALGAMAIGKPADRSRRPLRWYGLLEIGIGVYALAFPSLLSMAGRSWLLACAGVALPAALMGATLPVLARAAADTTQRGTRAFGGLYGVNTIGAVFGALLATFVLLESLGLAGTTRLAAFVNIGLGTLFWGLAVSAGEREVFVAPEDQPKASWRGDADFGVVVAFFLAGFAGLALQIAWIRLLVYFLEGFTIAFGLMLATYLLGLGAGSLGGTFLALRSMNPRRLLGRILMAEGICALATFLLVGLISDRLEIMRAGFMAAETLTSGYSLGLFAAAAVIIVPSTFCAGMLMPVVARIALSDRESIARQTGMVYAASTLGAVLAPAVAGFVLVPSLEVTGTIAAMAGLLLVTGSVLTLARGLKEWPVAAGAAVLFVAVFAACDLSTPLIERSHVFRSARYPRRLIEFREGTMAGVSVVEQYKDGNRRLYIDGFSAAETSRHYGYMRMLGHLPVLLHPKPDRVLVIAFGTGTTAGAVAVHEEVKELVCVEIEPRVYDLAGHFKSVNRDVLADPRVKAVVADGREFVQRDQKGFDVITLEPLMPYTPGAVYLYTREFYKDARSRLNRGGLLCQWIPPQGVANRDCRRLIKSMTEVFAHTSLWYFEHAILVLGADHEPRITLTDYLKRSARREVLADLEQARVGQPDHLLAAHVCSGEQLKKALGDVDAFTDDRTDLEFRPLPRRFGRRSRTYHAENLEFVAEHHQIDVAWLDDESNAVSADRRNRRRAFGAALATLAKEWRNRTEGGTVVPSTVLRPFVERDPRALFVRSIYDRRRYGELLGERRLADAAGLRYAPDRSGALLALARDSQEEQQQRFYLTMAVRQNHLLAVGERMRKFLDLRPDAAADLKELAALLEDPAQKRFCENRARILEGQPVEAGEEQLPTADAPNLVASLEAKDRDKTRDAFDMARGAGLKREAEKQAWEWFRKLPANEKRAAAGLLYKAGLLDVALRAARKLRTIPDLTELAAIYAAHYPRIRTWEQHCRHRSADVRAAMADAANELAQSPQARDFLRPLVSLLDPGQPEGVRLSAWIAFRSIHPDAESSGYDHRNPTAKAIAHLDGLALGKAAAVK